MNKYPVKKTNNQHYPTHPYKVNPSSPSSYTKGLPAIVPSLYGNNRNIAGQIETRIHLKNARGEEMNIYQTQSVLNLLNGATGNWFVGDRNTTQKKRRKY